MSTATVAGCETLARRFQALSDEKRLRILEILADGERCVCDLTEALDVGQSLLSFHLRTLREAGLVSDRRDGRWAYYSLVPEALAELRGSLGSLCGGSGVEAAADVGRSGGGAADRDPRCC